jgi:sucrose-6-phosphate hydrolase SacC (GH32 family)
MARQDNTRWITGNATRRGGELYQFVEQGFRGNPVTDLVDAGAGTHCGQSFWDAKGRRVQFMWLLLELPYATWIGAPTLPREIVLAPAGSVTGLWFRPLPEMSQLHVAGSQRNTSLSLLTGAGWRGVEVADGLHSHLLLTVTLSDAATVAAIEIRAGAKARAPGSLMVNVSRGAIQIAGPPCPAPVWPPCELKRASRATLRNSSVVELELFVDGPVTEIFANGGERALTSSANVLYIEGAALKAAATGGGTVSITATSFAMKKSVHVTQAA